MNTRQKNREGCLQGKRKKVVGTVFANVGPKGGGKVSTIKNQTKQRPKQNRAAEERLNRKRIVAGESLSQKKGIEIQMEVFAEWGNATP